MQPIGTYAAAHAKPKGPGDDRPTAMQILQDEGLLTLPSRLTDKTVLITGGTAGLGLEAAKALHATGAKVYISGRSKPDKGHKIAASASTDAGTYPVRFVHIDLSDLTSVKAGAETFLKESNNELSLLICCAGVMSPANRMTTAQDHELQFGVNYLSHFLLFKLLSPAMMRSSTTDFASRVVSVSSCAHRGGGLVEGGDYDFENTKYDPGSSYGQSKTANIYMANEIERRFGSEGLHSLSVHPGIIMETGLVRHMTDDGQKLAKQIEEGAPKFAGVPKSSQQGAAPIVWAAVSSKLEGTGGVYTEDCDISQPVDKDAEWFEPGRASWCEDQGAAEKLWSDSDRMLKSYI